MYILKATCRKTKYFQATKKIMTPVVAILKMADKVHIRRVSISQLLIHIKSKYFYLKIHISKDTFSGVFLNTLIQQNNKHFTDSSGGHFTKWPTRSLYQLLIHLKSKYLSKYTFSGLLIKNKVFSNTLLQKKN